MNISPVTFRRLMLVSVTAGALVLAGCGDSQPGTQGSTATLSAQTQQSPQSAQTSAATANPGQAASLLSESAGLAPLGDASADNKTQAPAAGSQLVVTGMRYGSHDSFERVVLDLSGTGSPGWSTELTSTPTRDGSGFPVEYKGTTALMINIEGTTYPFELGMEDPDLSPITSTGGVVTGVQSLGTFEGRSAFVIGLNGSHAYSIQTLNDPLRVVIDIRND